MQTPAPLYVVGLGPGSFDLLSPEALSCLEQSAVIAGYGTYIDLLPGPLLAGKRIIATGMRAEIQRVDAALGSAAGGKCTSLVCSGDPGIYAMAGLVLERLEKMPIDLLPPPVHIVPGIPALCAAAALLGAPLMHDFACISLSDLLTPWATIVRRLEFALQGDFVLVFYNPRSSRRLHQLDEAVALARKHRAGETPLGIVRNARRKTQECSIVTLDAFSPEQVDMFSILILGNASTRIIPGAGKNPLTWRDGARMLTPRGYETKY